MRLVSALFPVVRDFLSTIVFVLLIWLTADMVLATWVGVSTGVVQTAWMIFRKKHIGVLQWLSIGLVLTLGTTTIITHNGFFFKLKSSIIALALALATLRYEWMEPYLPALIRENLDRSTVMHASHAWAILLVAIAFLNIVVADLCSDRMWAGFIIIVPTIGYCVLIALQYRKFRRKIAVSIVRRRQMAHRDAA